MNIREVVTDIVFYFLKGYDFQGTSFFTQSFDELKRELRIKHFNEYRKQHPEHFLRTGHIISAVYAELLLEIRDEQITRPLSRGNPNSITDLINRSLNNLKDKGYSSLFSGENLRT